jgi:hypothetical protein
MSDQIKFTKCNKEFLEFIEQKLKEGWSTTIVKGFAKGGQWTYDKWRKESKALQDLHNKYVDRGRARRVSKTLIATEIERIERKTEHERNSGKKDVNRSDKRFKGYSPRSRG